MNTPSSIKTNVPLAEKTWFKTGGNARFYAEPTTALEFKELIAWAAEHKLELFMLGEGANILISDEGFDGLVIKPQLKYVAHQQSDGAHALVTAGAGTDFAELITYCLANNLGGLHEFSGIPGSVGGSVFINIHYFEHLLSQFLVSAMVIERATGKLLIVDNAWFGFSYNQSRLQDQEHYLIDAYFRLPFMTDLETAYARGRHDEIIRHRARRYPQQRTCGSFFRNFHNDEVSLEIGGKKMIYIGYYLDRLGIKGQLSAGNAFISPLHANMIVTSEGACSADVIALATIMQERVFKTFGILPEPECRLVGFATYPLVMPTLTSTQDEHVSSPRV